MPQPAGDLSKCDVSPIRKNNKHHITPRRSLRKTSRRDTGIDVHTAGTSTPNHSPQVLNLSLGSPPSSFPYSQENCPDVVWDYNSPKLHRGNRKKEIKLTIKELIDNLHHSQAPDGDPQPGQYVTLLENFMAKQTVDSAKSTENKKVKKKQPKRAIEELKKFLDTITNVKEESAACAISSQKKKSESSPGGASLNTSKVSISSKSFLDGDSTENDSTEELWGDIDNSFIVKATQELDSVVEASAKTNDEDLLSTIPETLPTSQASKTSVNVENKVSHISNLEKYSSILEQLVDTIWDSDDDDDWDKGFIEEDLTLIPEEILTGSIPSSDNERTICYTYTDKSNVSNDKQYSATNHSANNCAAASISNGIELTRGHLTSAELFNSFEDDSFEDASLLCQPDVLSRIDEVEYLMSQQPKCSPEEIEKKKDEAIKRRKNCK